MRYIIMRVEQRYWRLTFTYYQRNSAGTLSKIMRDAKGIVYESTIFS
jgi:hypothetical protein